MTVWVCDWTHWQGVVVPVKGIADEGYGMVKLKLGGSARDGRYFEDPMFFPNAVALLREPRLIPAAYWYLMPGRGAAQAGLMYSMLALVDHQTWATFLDVEHDGVTWRDVFQFAEAWTRLTGRQMALYTRQNFWQQLGAPIGLGADVFPFLEEAHWVSDAVRGDRNKPYASQQAKAIEDSWWSVNYGGWTQASMLQFSDNVMVQGKRTVASIYRGTKAELRAELFA